jgi:glutathione synthase/RimK-type ligase-like ATP-grasp enzyme
MLPFDITILTDSTHLGAHHRTPHIENIMEEDRLVQSALEKRGLKVRRINWDHPDVDWSDTRYIMFRSTWDYFDRYPEFNRWLERVKELTSMINPYEMVRWNLGKHYLLELAAKGIHIPPTRFMEKGDLKPLKALCDESGWSEIILKPVVSGGARHTYRFTPEKSHKYEQVLRSLVAGEAMMIQEFQQQVLEKGEVSFVVIGGKFTHAILKKAKSGDFRVQDDFGGTLHAYDPSQEEVAFAEKVVAQCDHQPLYARVDAIWDNQNQLAISEVELIEPELWFRFNPEAATLLAETFINYDQP